MGIVNRTPDSFFDGGAYLDDKAARAHVARLVSDGADVVDVGAESTRPGSTPVSAADQIDRIGDAIGWVVETGAQASIDTTLPEVAAFAVDQGATMINTVDPSPARELAEVAAAHGAELVLTHCRGAMSEMKGFSAYAEDAYDDLVAEVAAEWCVARDAALGAGLPPDRILFDPGLGFAKSAAQSLELCARLSELKARVGGHRVLVGPSRKSYLARTVAAELDTERPPADQRLGATIAACIDAAARGADIVRVHDVAQVSQALAYVRAVTRAADRGSSDSPGRGPEASHPSSPRLRGRDGV